MCIYIYIYIYIYIFDSFQTGSGQNGVVAEVPRLPLINFHWKRCANNNNNNNNNTTPPNQLPLEKVCK